MAWHSICKHLGHNLGILRLTTISFPCAKSPADPPTLKGLQNHVILGIMPEIQEKECPSITLMQLLIAHS